MLKILKDTRRRAVESILQTVGASEFTVDGEFDIIASKFDNVVAELNQISQSLGRTINSTRSLLIDCKEMSTLVHKVYDANIRETSWPDNNYKLQYASAAELYKSSWVSIDTFQNSISKLCSDEAKDPCLEASIQFSKAIEEEIKSRRIRLKDFDSYRRRLKTFEQKREAMEAQGKINTPAYIDTLAEIQRFEAKVSSAKDLYNSENLRTKQDIITAKQHHDELLDQYLITVVTAQAELFKHASFELESVLNALPSDKVTEVRAKVQEILNSGGVSSQAQPKDKRIFDFGQSVPGLKSEIKSQAPLPVAIATSSMPLQQVAIQQQRQTESTNNLDSGRANKEYAIALYDNEIEDDEELAFTAGQRIEVIEKDDSGWWRGKVDGRQGLFPINYVKME